MRIPGKTGKYYQNSCTSNSCHYGHCQITRDVRPQGMASVSRPNSTGLGLGLLGLGLGLGLDYLA